MLDILISPIVNAAASKRAVSYATYVISEAVCRRIQEDGIDYNGIVEFEKDNEGRITALKTDIVKLNLLKSHLSSDIYSELAGMRQEDLSIALGTVMGSSVFSGKGPKINVRVHSVGAVETDFENTFTSAGINQTNHRIMIKVNVNFSVILPFKVLPQTVETSVCAAESVIVGAVPEAFTNVQNFGYSNEGETVADEVVDFGAHNFMN